MKSEKAKNVLVTFGGISCEHDISVITGVLALNCLNGEKYNPVPFYITENGCFTGDKLFDVSFYRNFTEKGLTRCAVFPSDGRLYCVERGRLKPLCEVYCALNCCHGLNGEDGSVAGLMRLAGIPFASPDMLSSSVYMDKAATKVYLEGLGVKTLPYRVTSKAEYFRNPDLALALAERNIGYPAIVKPARLGSSIGVKRADDRNGLIAAVEYALKFDGKIIIEKALTDFTEINCAAYLSGGRVIVSECENPLPSGGILSFEDKYESGVKRGLTRKFPAEIPAEISDKIKAITEKVYRETYVNGVIRIDYLLSGEEIYLNEVNTVPGSLSLYLFNERTAEFNKTLTELIEEGVKARRDYDNGTFTYRSNVLSGVGGKKGVKRSTNRP